MAGTLGAIYNAQRALALNESLINIINTNIANMNTAGYSRQRAELEQATTGGLSFTPEEAIRNAMGSVIRDITRSREFYLDNYYRMENSDYNYYKELIDNASLIEDITNELDNIGINYSLDQFYKSINELANNPTDIVARNNVVQKGIELTTKMNSVYNRLDDLRVSLVGDYNDSNTLASCKAKTYVDSINDKLAKVADLNNSIILSSSQGTSPNALLDKRDLLLDELSELISVDITYETNGAVTVKIGNTNLVNGKEQSGFLELVSGTDDNPVVMQIRNKSGGLLVPDAASIVRSGKLAALLEIGGSEATDLTIKGIMDNLNTLAQQIAVEFNNLQTVVDANGEPRYIINGQLSDIGSGDAPPPNFFVDNSGAYNPLDLSNITAGNIKLSDAIINDPNKICAARSLSTDPNEVGNRNNALAMAQLRDKPITDLRGGTMEQFVTNLVGEIGSKVSTININHEIKSNITEQVGLRRESIIGINLDEEMTDLLRFQRSYEAAARVFNIINENLKTIINLAS
ncbi:MAG: flagellar hook-associated protein FlgK [Candidatus Gastranaerophilales bacterium]|nr:flagellar hook-associated protein FlgK [Candidatus Gastranaerophilales bacterium]